MKNKDCWNELIFTASRSSGPGGQNVNKVNTKVTLRFDIVNSMALTGEEKETLLKKLVSKATKEGVLVLSAEGTRSQLKNKQAVIAKFNRLLETAFKKKQIRKPTKPTFAAEKKRLSEKKIQAEKKKWRQKP